MSIISRKEFAELCGSDEKKLNVYIQRGKIFVYPTNKKLIDTDNPVNTAFIADRQSLNQSKDTGIITERPIVELQLKSKKSPKSAFKAEKTPKKEIVKLQSPSVSKKEIVVKREPRAIEQAVSAQYSISNRKIEQELAKKAQDMELVALRIQSEKIRLDKTAGNLLPIDLAMGVIERHANTILKTFEKGFERIADIYANFAGMDPNIRTDFIKECRVELSHCVETAGKSAEAEVDILVDNYAETLMVGQKKA